MDEIQPKLSKKIEDYLPIIKSPYNELKEVPEIHIIDFEKPGLIDAAPYYLLAYGHNLKKLGALLAGKQAILAMIITGAGQLLDWLAGYYKIKKKNIG
jgi:hypothetical protein